MTLKEDDNWKQDHGMEGIQHGMEKRSMDDIKRRRRLEALTRDGEMKKKDDIKTEGRLDGGLRKPAKPTAYQMIFM